MRRVAAFLGLLLLASGLQAGAKIVNKGNFGIAGWLVYWDPASMASFEKNADLIDRVYPEWYIVGEDGMPRSNEFNVAKPEETPLFLAKKRRTVELARAKKIQVFSMIVNFDKAKGEHSAERVEKVLQNEALRSKHILALVNNAVKDGADGIDIDYENLKAADAGAFSAFMAELKAACRKHGLLLAAALAPKMNAQGTWDGNQAHDYKALAASLDLIRPMTYDEHWATSNAGPVSSPEFSEGVDRYAVSVADPSKVELGIAAYGYDWKDKQAMSIGYPELLEILAKNQAKAVRDKETSELTFKYGQGREVWFCDSGSYRPKYEIIRKLKLAGMAIWRFGSEDPKFWDDVKQFKFAKDWK
jgi:spore germination protein YaaH